LDIVLLLDVIKKQDSKKLFEEIEDNVSERSKIIDTIKSRNKETERS
jgi:hypothetical protein